MLRQVLGVYRLCRMPGGEGVELASSVRHAMVHANLLNEPHDSAIAVGAVADEMLLAGFGTLLNGLGDAVDRAIVPVGTTFLDLKAKGDKVSGCLAQSAGHAYVVVNSRSVRIISIVKFSDEVELPGVLKA